MDLQDEGVATRLAGSMIPAGPAVLDRLADAVTTALQDTELRRGAREVAAEIAGLPDTAHCLPLLEQLVDRG